MNRIWQEMQCPSGWQDVDLTGSEMGWMGSSIYCIWCPDEHTVTDKLALDTHFVDETSQFHTVRNPATSEELIVWINEVQLGRGSALAARLREEI